jgi:hypothetical protein
VAVLRVLLRRFLIRQQPAPPPPAERDPEPTAPMEPFTIYELAGRAVNFLSSGNYDSSCCRSTVKELLLAAAPLRDADFILRVFESPSHHEFTPFISVMVAGSNLNRPEQLPAAAAATAAGGSDARPAEAGAGDAAAAGAAPAPGDAAAAAPPAPPPHHDKPEWPYRVPPLQDLARRASIHAMAQRWVFDEAVDRSVSLASYISQQCDAYAWPYNNVLAGVHFLSSALAKEARQPFLSEAQHNVRALGNVTRTASRLCKHYNRREVCPYGTCKEEQRQRDARSLRVEAQAQVLPAKPGSTQMC